MFRYKLEYRKVPLKGNLLMKITVMHVERGAGPYMKRINGFCPLGGDIA